jgi:alkanesulfonate monooxygenase SsuD/methylene tetrahydromethanopterin reductase-like flavin-dependent oxidoreductase (luciferase family)
VERAAKYGDGFVSPPETPKHEVAARYKIVQEGFAARGKEFGPQPLRRNILVADTREEAIAEYARVAKAATFTYARRASTPSRPSSWRRSSPRRSPGTRSSAPRTTSSPHWSTS